MADTQYYTFDTPTKYTYQIQGIENLEDANDVVYTAEELRELFGKDVYYWSSNVQLRTDLVKAELTTIKTKLIEGNLKSLKVTDADLIEALKSTDTPASVLVKGLRRTGNRFTFIDNTLAEERNKCETAFSQIVWGYFQVLRRKLGIEVDIKYGHLHRQETIRFILQTVTADEIIKWAEEKQSAQYSRYTQEDVEYIKKVLDGYETIFPPKPVKQEEGNDE